MCRPLLDSIARCWKDIHQPHQVAHIHRSVTAEAKTLNTGESATQLQSLKSVRITTELRNRHGRFAFQTHRSGPMLITTGCTAMATSTMVGERTGLQLKSHSPGLHKDCNTTRGVPAGSHDTQAALECCAVDANKATLSCKTVSTLLFLRSFEGFYALRPLTLATSPSQHPISSPPPPLPLLAKERLQRLSSRIQQSENNPGRYQNPSRKEICQDARATTTTTFLTTP